MVHGMSDLVNAKRNKLYVVMPGTRHAVKTDLGRIYRYLVSTN